MVKFGWDKLKRFLAQANTWSGTQTFANAVIQAGSVAASVVVDLVTELLSPPIIGKTLPKEVWASPSASKGPAIINSGFTGTISRSTTTLTFSEAADAILAGYSATNPILGTTVIHPTGPVTMYITAWINSTSCTVDSSGTLAAQTPTSFQLPIATFVDSSGVVKGWMNAAGGLQLGDTPGGVDAITATGLRISDSTGAYYLRITPGNGEMYSYSNPLLLTSNSSYVIIKAQNSEKVRIDTSGNLLLGLTAAGTSAAKVLAMGEATAPTTSPANAAQVWPENLDANGGNNRLWTRTEDGVHSPLSIKSETDAQANPKAPAQGVNMTYAASASTGIAVGDDANIDFGTGNFTLSRIVKLSDWTPTYDVVIVEKNDDTNGYTLLLDTTGVLRVTINTTDYDSTVVTGLADNANAVITAVVTRETAAVAGSVVFYVNGTMLGASVAITAGSPTTVTNAVSLYVSGTAAIRYSSDNLNALTFNRALTAAEVLDLYRNGVSFADKWGSQTAVFADDMADNDTGNWTVIDCTLAFDTDHYEIDYVADTQHVHQAMSTLTQGKSYRVSLDIKDGTVASRNITLFAESTLFTSEHSSGQLTTTASWVTHSFEFTAGAGIYIFRMYVQMSGAGNMEIKNLSIVEIGATLALEEKGIWLDKWYDSTTNNLVASYPTVGWTLTQQENKKRVKQPTPTAETTAVTLTIAKLLTGIITATHTAGATQAYTLTTGALADAWPAFGINDYFDWVLINLSAAAADTVTVTAAATGHTIVGNPIVQSAHASTGGIYGNSAGFRTVKTAAATFISYRIN